MSTIFSKIIAGEIPAQIVYENEAVLAFLDINPVNPGHTLVIPKTASADGLTCTPETLAELMVVGQKIGQAQIKVLSCEGVNFIMNNGAAAGQEVFHTHLHVVPRFTNDGSYQKPRRRSYQNTEAEEIKNRLKTAL